MLLGLLRQHLKPYQWPLVLVIVLQSAQTLAALMLPSMNADIIDQGVATGDTGYIWTRGSEMLVVSVVQIVLTVAAVFVGAKVAMAFGRDLRTALFHRVTEFSSREVSTFGAPSLITRITNDVQQVQVLVLMTCTLLIGAPVTVIGGTIMAMRQDVQLSIILAVAIPVLMIAIGNVIMRMIPAFRRMQDEIDGVNQILREQITGVRVVRAFVHEDHEMDRFASGNSALTGNALTGGRMMSLMFPTVTVIVNLSSVAAVWMGAGFVEDGSLQVGSLIAFLTYLVQILMAVLLATYMAALVPRATVSSERIVEVLDTSSTVVPPSAPVRPTDARASVEMRGVGFHYPGAEHAVLSDITFRCEAGTTTAIVGSTGSGKTTLINLVARLFDATSGEVLVNGVDVRDIDPEFLWNRIGLVPQRPYLFSGTVASNLRFGRPDASEEDMWEALRIAQAADFVAAMPGGLEASISQGGTNVSGGQRQRLAIARALVRRPDVYVFDDSFSALDLATDARLRAALTPVTRDAAVLVVAQRVSTIMQADQIVVLEDGEIVGIGRHEELLLSCATYDEIVASQITGDEVVA